MTPQRWLEKFAAALAKGDIDGASKLFEPGGFWRDLVAFTWTIKTFEGRAEVKAMLAAVLSSVRPSGWTIRGSSSPEEAWFTFRERTWRDYLDFVPLAKEALLDLLGSRP